MPWPPLPPAEAVEPGRPELSPEATPERVARAVGEDGPVDEIHGDTDSAEPMDALAPTAGVAQPPAKVARAARSKASAKPKRPPRRRSDAGDETPSEG